MGFIKSIGSVFSQKAWVEQYVENFQGLLRGAEIEHPSYPRCAHLAIAWSEQFNLPFCPIPPDYNTIFYAKALGSFYSCLDKPNDSEALGLYAVMEAKGNLIEERFRERYKLLAGQILEDLSSENYAALQQKFATRNPNGAKYFAVAVNQKLSIRLTEMRLQESNEDIKQHDFVSWEEGITTTFGIWGYSSRNENHKILKWHSP